MPAHSTYGVQQGFSDAHGATMGYTGAMIAGIILLVLAFLSSLLIPKPAQNAAEEH